MDKGVLLKIARESIQAHLSGKVYNPPIIENKDRYGVFVTLWKKPKRLRGCIGHIEPFHTNLSNEVQDCAIAAATEDPRFPDLKLPELKDIWLEISLLHPATYVRNVTELNPAEFGIIVTLGHRRGLLLPEIDGIETVDQQIQAVKEKAGIAPFEIPEIQKFKIEKISEAK